MSVASRCDDQGKLPKYKLHKSTQPVVFLNSAVEITTDSVVGWTVVPSRTPTIRDLAMFVTKHVPLVTHFIVDYFKG